MIMLTLIGTFGTILQLPLARMIMLTFMRTFGTLLQLPRGSNDRDPPHLKAKQKRHSPWGSPTPPVVSDVTVMLSQNACLRAQQGNQVLSLA